MSGFGQYATEQSATNLEAGMYNAIIESAMLVLDNDGAPKENDNGKKLVDVMFMVDRENKVRRRYSIAYGQNTANGQWAGFAKLIEAATGLKCGDKKAQGAVGPEDLRGREVRIVVAENDRGYMDVQNVLPPSKNSQKPKPAPVPEDEVPFPEDDPVYQ